MRMLGLLGGMSWESSIEYERLINRGIRGHLGGTSSADLVIRSFNFAQIEALQLAGNWDAAGDILADAAQSLHQSGAEAVMICANTMHLLAERVQHDLPIPLIHIVDETGAEIQRRGVSKVLLLGTRYTMEKDFFKLRLADKFNLEVLVPESRERDEIHRIIYDELVRGVLSENSRKYLVELVEGFAAQGVQGVIAGCTEIELLVKPEDVSIEHFPTLQIHADAAVRFILGL